MAVQEKREEVLSLAQPTLKPSLYINRELSLLDFNSRVLEEALDARNPLLERVKFLSIFNSNLDEFFMIRLSGIREQVKAGIGDRSPDGMTPTEEMTAMRKRVRDLLDKQAGVFPGDLCPGFAARHQAGGL